MYKLFLLFLLVPGLSHGQAKKAPVKKKKAGQVKSNHKTFWPPKLPATDVTIPPPALPYAAETVNGETNTLQLIKSSSFKAAVQQAAEKHVGLLLFMPGDAGAGLLPKNSAVPRDSAALNTYFEELFAQGVNAYKRKYLVYMATAAGLAAEKNIHALVYPAYFFFSADGVLLGKSEGLKADAYELDALQQELQDAFERKELLQLQQQYRQGTLDSTGLAKLVLLTNAYNAGAYAQPMTPDQYQLLDVFIRKYGVEKKVDSGFLKLVDQVYNDAGYIHEIKLPGTFAWLLQHYTTEADTDFKWYAALSNHINEKYTALTTPKEEETASRPDSPALSSNAAATTAGNTALALDSLLKQHFVWLRHLRNVQLLNEAVKLVQVQYDLISKKQVPTAYIHTHTMPLLNWLYDSLLHVNTGMASTALVLKEVKEKMSVAEMHYVDDYYTDFAHFETGFKKDLALLLNNTSWMIFKEDADNRYLAKLLSWSKASLEIEKANPYYLDTYAQLLYAGGDKKAAFDYEQKAITALKLDKNFREEKWMLPFMEKVLAKMKLGAVIPRDDYNPNE